MKGETRTPEYLAMNPMHSVPTLKDADGTCVFESNAILRYVCNRYAEQAAAFYPSEPKLRGKIEMALDFRQLSLYKQIGNIAYPAMGFSQDKSTVEPAKTAIVEPLQILCNYFLGANKFIGGDTPSIADFAIVPTFEFLRLAQFELPVDTKDKITKYIEDFKAAVPFYSTAYEGDGGFGIKAFAEALAASASN
jgi:glutathione S-transferase